MTNLFECEECGTKKPKSQMYRFEAYDTPWDDTPRILYVCKEMPQEMKDSYNMQYRESCEELLTDSSWADFRYFECDECGRFICEQNPRNGWHVQYRELDHGHAILDYAKVCLKCYESMMFEDGLTDDDLEAGKLSGMFFNDSELEEHGFQKIPEFDYVHVTSETKAKQIIERAKILKASGHKVVINYESMAIGGLEGYVTLWAAPVKS